MLARRWRDLAYLARYGNQQIPLILGRPLRPLELRLFLTEVHELVIAEMEARAPFNV